MKKCFPVMLAILFSYPLLAQHTEEKFGVYTESNKNLTKVDYDDGAGAVCIFNIGKSYCTYRITNSTSISVIMTRHVRIKILEKKGLPEANIKFQYAIGPNGQTVNKLHAQTANLNSQGEWVISKVEKSMIYDKKKTKRINEITLAFPEVRIGSILEYEYEIESNGLYLSPWYFQTNIPVEYSKFTLDFPFELNITAKPLGIYEVKQDSKSSGSRYQKTFTIEHIPGLRNEIYISSPIDYLQKVIPILYSLDIPGQPVIRLLKPWDEMVKELLTDEDFGSQLKKNIPHTTDLDNQLKGVTDEFVKMNTIYKYVRTNMHPDELSGIWADKGIKAAWKEKKGTPGEINMILINLLKSAGINASPILVSTHENGMANPTVISMSQFNAVMAYVQISNQAYVLDATEKYTPASLCPESVLFSQGLVIEDPDSNKWGWKQITDNIYGYSTDVNVQAIIDQNGLMKGKAVVRTDDYERIGRTQDLNSDSSQYASTYLKINDVNAEIDSLTTENLDKEDFSLIHQFNFKSSIASTGDYHFIPVNMFGNIDKNEFLSNERISDILFKAKKTFIFNELFTIPEGYYFDDLPKNILMRTPDSGIVFKRISSAKGNILSIKIEINFLKPIYAYDEYESFSEFYKKMFGFLNEQFIYKKDG